MHKLPYWIDEDIVTKDRVHWRDESKMDNNVGVKREDSAKVERSSGLEGNSRFSLDDEIRKMVKMKEQRDKEQADKRSTEQQKNLMKSDSHVYECLNSDEEEPWKNDWRDQRNYRGFNAERERFDRGPRDQRSEIRFSVWK